MQKVDGRRANKDAITASPATNCSCPGLAIAENILAQAIQRINYSTANQECVPSNHAKDLANERNLRVIVELTPASLADTKPKPVHR
jgi:hypothetical protein